MTTNEQARIAFELATLTPFGVNLSKWTEKGAGTDIFSNEMYENCSFRPVQLVLVTFHVAIHPSWSEIHDQKSFVNGNHVKISSCLTATDVSTDWPASWREFCSNLPHFIIIAGGYGECRYPVLQPGFPNLTYSTTALTYGTVACRWTTPEPLLSRPVAKTPLKVTGSLWPSHSRSLTTVHIGHNSEQARWNRFNLFDRYADQWSCINQFKTCPQFFCLTQRAISYIEQKIRLHSRLVAAFHWNGGSSNRWCSLMWSAHENPLRNNSRAEQVPNKIKVLRPFRRHSSVFWMERAEMGSSSYIS